MNAKGNSTARYSIEDGKTVSLTDIVLQNPAGDAGILEIRRKDDVILRVNLVNFRDLDYHFVSPVVFGSGQEVVLAVQCANPDPAVLCTPAVYLAGFVRQT